MSFSLNTFVFLFCVISVFYLIRRRARAYFLLASSLIFIVALDYRSCIFAVSVSCAAYLAGLFEEYLKEKKMAKALRAAEAVFVALCVFSLIILKHVANWSFDDNIFSGIILPIGFSYYIFQAISYIVDVKRDILKAEKNLLFFMLYLCYFPKFVSGPIEKPDKMLLQIKSIYSANLFDKKRLSVAFPTILYGFFMKVVIADRLSIFTSRILDTPQYFGFGYLFAGMIMYTIQIYCDFAGYSSIAVGVSKIFGINLTENFRIPYLSDNISTFWRRWHISLSSWLRDYIYIPLGGNRKGFLQKCINTMIVFIICGMWHGYGLCFIIWGFLHGMYSVIHLILEKKFKRPNTFFVRLIGIAVTFFEVAFAWIFFGSWSAGSALNYITGMLTLRTGEFTTSQQISNIGFGHFYPILLLFGAIVFLLDLLMQKKDLSFGNALLELPAVFRYIIEYLLIFGILLLGVYGPGYSSESFMYMNF